MATPGITGIRTGIRQLPRRRRSKRRYATTQPIRRMKTGMTWMQTEIGIQSRAKAMYGFPPALERVGIRMGPAIGPTIRPLATPGFQAIPGAGSLTIAARGVTTPSVGAGLRVVAAATGLRWLWCETILQGGTCRYGPPVRREVCIRCGG